MDDHDAPGPARAAAEGRVPVAVAVTALVGGTAAATAYATGRVLRRQAAQARRAIGKPLGEEAPPGDRHWRRSYGDPIDLLVLGDSIAAGLGAEKAKHTLGGRLARGLAKRTKRSVRLRTAAVVGSESSALAGQLDALPPSYRPHVAVVVVGGNDVTHRVPVADSVRHLAEAVDALRARGAEVVVGTCPDLGALRPVPQPLRALGSRASRQLAEAQRVVALEHGARVVSLAHVVGPFFVANPDEMFSLDRFHPSAQGYKRTAAAVLPSVLAALGVVQEVPFGHHAPAVGASG
ncbi:SGNH/GDSL hydrolase family protein [Nocardioides zeicaulis]|uniref:SGNH/GDSL hydrolase family protein n=1 Tax=Nocardioides zeicaulis TaxID=1776857 RepID=A0ABV6E3N3_9ACTN